MNTAEYLLAALARRGTKRIYGVPGGGSSLDIIAAAERFGIRFILARHEGNAAMMAVADAEVTGAPGVVLTTKGPGLMNALNGIACAALERAPVLLLTDGFTEKQLSYITHQVFDQRAATAELVKGYSQARSESPAAEIEALLDLAMQAPIGPVHLDLASEAARRLAGELLPLPVSITTPLDNAALAHARAMLAAARKPVILAGVEAVAAAEPLRALVAALGCPALVTYKAKGVIADTDPHFVGIFTGGSLEAPCVQDADLIILAGLDPVELILQPWRYSAPVLDIGLRAHPVHYVTPTASLHGALEPAFTALTQSAQRSAWNDAVIAGHRDTMRAALTWQGSGGVAPPRIVTLAQEAARRAGCRPRISVDAGAHMFSATAFWECAAPRDVLISNGLASMGFALPAALAAALENPSRGAIAFTGDGGLMMCVAEIATAVEAGAPCITIVFNDGALSLIDIKQQQRQLPPEGVRWARPDFAAIAEGFGAAGFRASTEAEYITALDAAFAHKGPSLIDVTVNPAGYAAQLQAMRG
ncbi:MAG: thiamine pyrophosphate-binding protein [Roseomonas sp.]|nr:thiamine pyrophosphate-binding protein [Roseomonas sp.]MCA3317373.1 thiamine pyrophosphate-binding protein [Roseomonas sp.]MCA3320584.1 thiamine pyrophosphate-binding protein [Roseomonas sp.]